MYTVNKTRSRKKAFLYFFSFVMLLILAIAFLLWFIMFRTNGEISANFSRTGGTVAIIKPSTELFTTEEFKLTLPSGWELLGKENPVVDEEYYYFQSKVENYTNRWLKVFVDVFPEDYPLNKLLPVTADGNRLKAGLISNDCKTFDGAPKPGSQEAIQTWTAVWEEINFTCNMENQQNHIGTASIDDGYGVKVVGESGAVHKYFLVYIDHNIRPDVNILIDAVDSFEAL